MSQANTYTRTYTHVHTCNDFLGESIDLDLKHFSPDVGSFTTKNEKEEARGQKLEREKRPQFKKKKTRILTVTPTPKSTNPHRAARLLKIKNTI